MFIVLSALCLGDRRVPVCGCVCREPSWLLTERGKGEFPREGSQTKERETKGMVAVYCGPTGGMTLLHPCEKKWPLLVQPQ